jgi:hypothetical protein
MLSLLIGTALEGSSQTIDTICFPFKDAQEVLIAAKQKKKLDTLVQSLSADIRSYEITTRTLLAKDSANKEIVATYQAMVGTMREQRTVFEGQINVLNREVRKWKNRSRWTAIGGILLTGIVTTLFIIK